VASSTSKRLALFISTLNCGGAERVTVNLLRAATDRGLLVDLILARSEGGFLADVPSSVRVVDLGAAKLQHGIPRLARYLRRERPHGVISHVTQANVAILLARMLARVESKVVAVEHINMSQWIASGGIRPRVKSLASWLYPRADAIVGVSHGVARDVERCLGLPPGRVRAIYNPIVDDRLTQRAAGPSPHRWFTDGPVPTLVSVGRLFPQKDYPTLLRAISLVRQARPVRLVIFGEGPERGRLESLRDELGLAAEVDLPGMTNNPYAAMRRASLFVLSSRFEGLPTVLVEALACGCPVVATDCPDGPAEILDHGRLGTLVAPGDPAALADGISRALQCHPDHEALKQRGADFSFDSSLDGYLDALDYPLPSSQLVPAA
jgi:glycosyltransferase involved in cell wall biosynthesis